MGSRALEPAPSNPYAPPSPGVDAEAAPLSTEGALLATPWQRWLGAFVDNLIAAALLAPAFIVGAALGGADDVSAARIAAFGAFVGFAAYVVLQSVLIVKTGQSVGKRVVKTRIILQSGYLPGFWQGVVLRSWLIQALALIPLLGGFIGLLDVLMVFRSDRRCLHDHIAGTRVVQA